MVGVIGCGRWGPNHVRVLDSLPGCSVRALADRDEQALAAVARQHPAIGLVTPSAAELIACDDVQAVVVATPPRSCRPIFRWPMTLALAR